MYKYLLLREEDYQQLFVENDKGVSFWFSPRLKMWVYAGWKLSDARVGYDPSESEGSGYRFANSSEMKKIIEVSKEEAEKFLNQYIDDDEIIKLFEKKRMSLLEMMDLVKTLDDKELAGNICKDIEENQDFYWQFQAMDDPLPQILKWWELINR